MHSDVFRAMNTEIVLLAEGDETRARPGFQKAREFIEASEARFTRFSEDSELSKLNRAAGRWYGVSPDFLSLMEEARDLYFRTRGLFDPSILPQLKHAGYTSSMDMMRGKDLPLPSAQADIQKGAFSQVETDTRKGSICLPEGMQIDLGGIAKGWIAERAAVILKEYSRACAVNAGGDMFLQGHPDDQDHWEVALEDPRDISQELAILNVGEGAVATSSVTRRTWMQGGERRHHLIDPRTGLSADTRWLCVTVMAPHAAQAEAFAKAFLMASDEEAGLLRAEQPDLTVLGVSSGGELTLIGEERESLNVH